MAGQVVYEDLESGTPDIAGLEGATAKAGDETSDGAAAPKQAQEPKGGEPKQSAKDLAAAQARIRELEGESRFWAEKAKGGAPAEPKKAEQPDELEALLANAGVDDDTAAALLDDIGEKGVAALEKRGLVTKTQLKAILSAVERRMEAKAEALADGKIAGARGQMSAEAKLLKDFPELADESSALAKATAKEFAEMVADDASLKNSYAALRMAAKVAKANMGSGGGTISERMQRIASQAPSRGARMIDEFADDEIEITPEARVFINAGSKFGLTEEAYRKNARRTA
jgi:hypothetical protein